MTVEIRLLAEDDDRRAFSSGDEALDLYFHRYAGQNQFRHHIGATYVAVEGDRILGFATVSAGSIDAEDLPGGCRMPSYPMPVLRLARLAVGAAEQGRGVGRALLRFTVELAERMRVDVGCVGPLVDAKGAAVDFYRALGFVVVDAVEGAAPIQPGPTLMFLPLAAVPRSRS